MAAKGDNGSRSCQAVGTAWPGTKINAGFMGYWVNISPEE